MTAASPRECTQCGAPACCHCGQEIIDRSSPYCLQCGEVLPMPVPATAAAPAAHAVAVRRNSLRWIIITVVVLMAITGTILIILRHGTTPTADGQGRVVPVAGVSAQPAGSAPGPSPNTSLDPTSASPVPPASPVPSATPKVLDPIGVVTAYFDAINRHDYRAAWDLGGDHLGGTYQKFAAGFAETAKDVVTIRSVSGGTVNVDLAASQTDGSVIDFSGAYKILKGVIVSASLKRTSG